MGYLCWISLIIRHGTEKNNKGIFFFIQNQVLVQELENGYLTPGQ